MRAIILAAGQGTRLRPLTENMPKCLMNVGGESILAWQIRALKENNIQDITIVTGFMSHLVEQAVRGIDGISFIKNDAFEITNNIQSLKVALEVSDMPSLIMNGDTIFHRDVIDLLLRCGGNGLAVQYNKNLDDEAMKFKTAEKKIITRLGKGLDDPEGEFTGVCYIQETEFLLECINELDNVLWFEEAINLMIQSSAVQPIDVTRYPGMEIDTQEDLWEANEYFKFYLPDWEFGIRHTLPVDKKKAKALLFDVLDCLEAENFQPILNFGLLLGAVRNRDFIEWDSDMDISIFIESGTTIDDMPYLMECEDQFEKKGIFIPKENVFPCERWYIRDGEKVELTFIQKIDEWAVHDPGRTNWRWPFEKYFSNLDKINFLGRECFCPAYVENYLEFIYGPEWRTPKRGFKTILPNTPV